MSLKSNSKHCWLVCNPTDISCPQMRPSLFSGSSNWISSVPLHTVSFNMVHSFNPGYTVQLVGTAELNTAIYIKTAFLYISYSVFFCINRIDVSTLRIFLKQPTQIIVENPFLVQSWIPVGFILRSLFISVLGRTYRLRYFYLYSLI